MSGGRSRLVVYAARSWVLSAFVSTRVWPIMCPSVNAETPGLLRKLAANTVYFRLHGLPGQPFFYGDPGWPTAISFEQIRSAPDGVFTGSDIFLEGCFGSRAAGAFMEAGAASVTGCRIATFGHPTRQGPSSKVGRRWLVAMRKNRDSKRALRKALIGIPAPFAEGWESFI